MISGYKIYRFALTAIAAILPLGVCAQLRESVEVRGEYQKEILYPDKLGRLPQRLRPAAPQSDIPYSLQGVEADFVPYSPAIPATSYGACRPGTQSRVELSLAMGSWLNSRLAAGVTLMKDEAQSLNLWLRHSSTSLWQPYKEVYADAGETAPRRFSYQESLGLDWIRNTGTSGQLHASLAYRFGYFNYYGLMPDLTGADMVKAASGTSRRLPARVINDISAEAGYSSSPFTAGQETDRNKWSVGLGVRHLGFNLATKETHLRLSGDYARMLGDSRDYGLSYPSIFGVDMVLDALLYGSSDYRPITPASGLVADNYYHTPANYGNMRLAPFYSWNNGKVGLRAGVNVDLTFNASPVAGANSLRTEGHYNLFHISPDVRFDFSAGKFAAYIHALGGQELMTLASITDRNLYCAPYLQSTTPVFVPLDAKIGFRVSPVSGLSIDLGAGYRLTRNVPFCGWDTPLMNKMYYPAVTGLPELPLTAGYSPTYGLGEQRYDLAGIYADVNVDYKIGKIMDLHAVMQYSPQSADGGIFNGADRPRWILTPGVEIRPVAALTLGVDYEYRGVRKIWSGSVHSGYYRSAPANGGGTSVGPGSTAGGSQSSSPKEMASMRLPDITRLNAHAAYRFGDVGALHNFSIGVEAENLLNHNDILLPGLPSEGLTVSGIIRMEF